LALQLVPPQHGCVLPPHWQLPDAQLRLALHIEPVQQVWPLPPHGMHRLEMHKKPLAQLEPQHGWPLPPHGRARSCCRSASDRSMEGPSLGGRSKFARSATHSLQAARSTSATH
jgi:hypothetical protein